jgi:hypothetical protein
VRREPAPLDFVASVGPPPGQSTGLEQKAVDGQSEKHWTQYLTPERQEFRQRLTRGSDAERRRCGRAQACDVA